MKLENLELEHHVFQSLEFSFDIFLHAIKMGMKKILMKLFEIHLKISIYNILQFFQNFDWALTSNRFFNSKKSDFEKQWFLALFPRILGSKTKNFGFFFAFFFRKLKKCIKNFCRTYAIVFCGNLGPRFSKIIFFILLNFSKFKSNKKFNSSVDKRRVHCQMAWMQLYPKLALLKWCSSWRMKRQRAEFLSKIFTVHFTDDINFRNN